MTDNEFREAVEGIPCRSMREHLRSAPRRLGHDLLANYLEANEKGRGEIHHFYETGGVEHIRQFKRDEKRRNEMN